MTDPTVEDALRVTSAALGVRALDARRFTTGLHHFVYEVDLADGRSVVARLTRAGERGVMRNAVALSRQLRPLGVPLPQMLAADLEAEHPWMLLERLPGRDLGDVVGSLGNTELKAIAAHVAAAQLAVWGTPSAGRFGFSAAPKAARYATWSDVVVADIQRSRGRIVDAGLFDPAVIEPVEEMLRTYRDELEGIPATPFLHDTTTKNVIVTDAGEFSGIVDVDDLCFGDPRFVTALTHVALHAHDLPTAYADHFMHAAGLRDDRLYRLYIAVILLGFMSEHGQMFNGNQQPSSAEARHKLLGKYQDALTQV